MYVIHESRAPELLNPSRRPKTWLPVICHGPARHMRHAILLGCSDYLKEPWSPFELFYRVKKFMPSDTYAFEWGDLTLAATTLCANGRKLPISIQEYRVLKTLLQQRGNVVPREVLFYSLWGKPGASSRAIDMHVSSLRNKLLSLLPGETAKGIIRTVRHVGYAIT